MNGASEKVTGFNTWLNFFRSTIALGITITALLYAVLTWAMDERYAPSSIAGDVQTLKADVHDLKTSVDSIQTNLLHDSLFTLRVQSCSASSQDAKRFFEAQIQQKIDEFVDLTGHKPSVPKCEDIQ